MLQDRTMQIKSTSKDTADVSPITLREGPLIRLVFIPVMINNPNDRRQCMKGTFCYQKKVKNTSWEEIKTTSLSSLKAGDEYNLSLHSEELFALLSGLLPLYKVHNKDGIPWGEEEYVRAPVKLAPIVDALCREDDTWEQVVEYSGSALIVKLLKWLCGNLRKTSVVEGLQHVSLEELSGIESLIGIQKLKDALKEWESNQANDSEEFWHNLFLENPWIVASAVNYPIILFREKAYVGGKTIDNRGGNVVDFIYKNKLTENSVLVEIKTPTTPILGRKYRNNAYAMSEEITGAINQVISYRDSLLRESAHILKSVPNDLHIYYPKCLVIIGALSNIDNQDGGTKCFEAFRGEMKNIEIVCFM